MNLGVRSCGYVNDIYCKYYKLSDDDECIISGRVLSQVHQTLSPWRWDLNWDETSVPVIGAMCMW